MSKISLYVVALTLPFTCNKGPNLNPETQPTTIIPHPPNLGIRHFAF